MMIKAIAWCMMGVVLSVFSLPVLSVYAVSDDPFVLIPAAKDTYETTVDKLTTPTKEKKFRKDYNAYGDKLANDDVTAKRFWCDLGAMLSSGVVTRDTLLCLIVRLVKFITNMALVVGSAMIIYAGYLYVVAAISGGSVDDTSKAQEAVKDAMIGVVIVVFSYAIQRIVTQAFLN